MKASNIVLSGLEDGVQMATGSCDHRPLCIQKLRLFCLDSCSVLNPQLDGTVIV
jgi:hypothetical protein